MVLRLAQLLVTCCWSIDPSNVQRMERLRHIDTAILTRPREFKPEEFKFEESNKKTFTECYESLVSYLKTMIANLGLMAFLDIKEKISLNNLPR